VEGIGPMKPWQPIALHCGANSYPSIDWEDKSEKKITKNLLWLQKRFFFEFTDAFASVDSQIK